MNGYDPTDLHDQELRAKQANDKAREELQLEVADFKWIMSNKRGRRFIWRFLERAGVHRNAYTSDPYDHAFAAGCKNEGTRVLAMVLEHAPDAYVLMLSEHKTHDRSRNDSTDN